MNLLPFNSSLAKKAARQSCKVTVGPQNQLGTHETTNLKYHRQKNSNCSAVIAETLVQKNYWSNRKKTTNLLKYSTKNAIQPWGAYASPQDPALTREVWWFAECSLARSSLPGIGKDKSWKVSRVTETYGKQT